MPDGGIFRLEGGIACEFLQVSQRVRIVQKVRPDRFEEELTKELARSACVLVDLGFLANVDRDGIAAIGRIIEKAEESGVKIQFIRVTPKIADLLSYSELKNLLTKYVSRSEETAVRRLLD